MRLGIATLICVCLVVHSLNGQVPSAPDRQGADEAAREKIISGLGLTAEQKAAIEERKAKREAALSGLFATIEALRQSIQEEFRKPVLDRERVRELNRESKELVGKAMDIRLESLLEVREILTPAQHAKMIELSGATGTRETR